MLCGDSVVMVTRMEKGVGDCPYGFFDNLHFLHL